MNESEIKLIKEEILYIKWNLSGLRTMGLDGGFSRKINKRIRKATDRMGNLCKTLKGFTS